MEAVVPDSDADLGRLLTPRERDVLVQASYGKSNREIGEALAIAEQTVKNHLAGAMRKLSLNDRTHAVVVAIAQGLIPLPVADGSSEQHGVPNVDAGAVRSVARSD